MHACNVSNSCCGLALWRREKRRRGGNRYAFVLKNKQFGRAKVFSLQIVV